MKKHHVVGHLRLCDARTFSLQLHLLTHVPYTEDGISFSEENNSFFCDELNKQLNKWFK